MRSNSCQKTAIAVVLFNRPDLVTGLFDCIREYSPDRLYLIADGPRVDREGEREKCNQAQQVALQSVSWDCEVIKVFSDVNLGCRDRIVSGLDYVFEREERAIILEDDTYPNFDFFRFCDQMLERYASDQSIISITGTNIIQWACLADSEFRSNYTHIWGWATWRRSWALYDRNLVCLGGDQLRLKMRVLFGNTSRYSSWMKILHDVKIGEINTWDYQLQATAWLHGMKCITPPRNLVANAGFRPDATHTMGESLFAGLIRKPLKDIKGVAGRNWVYDVYFGWVFHHPVKVIAIMIKAILVLRRINRR